MGFSDNLLLFLLFLLIRHCIAHCINNKPVFYTLAGGYINFSLIFALQMYNLFAQEIIRLSKVDAKFSA